MVAKKLCPDCGHDKFFVTATERHTWIVDGHENFEEDYSVDECEIVADTKWKCCDCGAEFKNNKDFVTEGHEEDDYYGPIPDEYDDPKASFERMSEYELRHK